MKKIIKKTIKIYYNFFDHKLKNTTIIVGLIGAIITFVGLFLGNQDHKVNPEFFKNNVLEITEGSILNLGGKEYVIKLKK